MDISSINSFALSFLTLALVIYTALLWYEAKKTRIQNLTPQISLSFYPMTGPYMGLMIVNTGKIDAVNVKIECLNTGEYEDRNKQYKYADKLSKEYSYFPVNQVYKYSIGYYSVIENEKFLFKVSAYDISTKHKIEYNASVHMDHLRDTLIGREYEKQIADSLTAISKKLDAITTFGGNSAIRCHTYPQQYREDESISQKICNLQWAMEGVEKAVSELKNKE